MPKIDNVPPESWWNKWKAAYFKRAGPETVKAVRLLALSHFRRGFKPQNSAALCLLGYGPQSLEKIRTEEPEEERQRHPNKGAAFLEDQSGNRRRRQARSSPGSGYSSP